jgi:hypothetical protein
MTGVMSWRKNYNREIAVEVERLSERERSGEAATVSI